MPAERAGYTVTMFLIDTGPSMGKTRIVDLPPGPNGEEQTTEMTNLEWALQFVKLKVQEMIFNGRKTDQCGVITFGSQGTNNIINSKSGGYDNVSEYIRIAQPNVNMLTKISALEPTDVYGDPIDALIVGIETQADYLSSKKTWTRKIILVTDGESQIEIEDWEATVHKMNALDIHLTVVGVDFDDEDFPYVEPDKSKVKQENEKFYQTFVSSLKLGVIGTCAFALQETTRPDIKQTRSALMGTVLRLGDTESRTEEALEINVKTSKCTALARPKGWKKFALRTKDDEDVEMNSATEDEEKLDIYVQLKMRTEYFIDQSEEHDEDGEGEDIKMEVVDEDVGESLQQTNTGESHLEKVEKEQLVRGFKYGTTYAPCPDGQFPRLPTKKGIDLCGFFPAKNFRRELSLGEIQYVWADPSSAQQQVALSSIVQAMYEKNVMAIARWVTRDDMDPKMGVLAPTVFDKVDCLLWAQMPFADDVRKYTFASLDNLITKQGETLTEHPYLPTAEQLKAMDDFVDSMDLMEAGEKDEEGNRVPWFDTRLSYNPAIHRTKQALFHCAVVTDITTNPLPPPHPELLKYFDPPKKVIKRAKKEIEACKRVFKVKQVPKKVARARADGHVHAQEEDEGMLLLDRQDSSSLRRTHSEIPTATQISPTRLGSNPALKTNKNDSDTEEEDEEELLLDRPATKAVNQNNRQPLPTPARSTSPQIDPKRAPGRIIGSTYPLADFKKNLERGDVVSKAVKDLADVITEIVMKPFASRRRDELLECTRVLRDTCLQEDEIDAWNEFLPDLRKKCLAKPGNPEFWSQVRGVGRELSLIGLNEALKFNGVSSVSDNDAEEFLA